MKKIDTDELNLSEYLSIKNGVLQIPYSQRPYEWGEIQVKRLFFDLVALNDNEENRIHMLNFFTFSGEGNKVKIFDGQQRTVTLLLLASVFIKKIYDLGNENAANQFYRDYIVEEDFRTSEVSEKRKIIFDDEEINELFYEITSLSKKQSIEMIQKKSAKPIIMNHKLLTELLEEYIENRELKLDGVLNLFNQILDKAQLITIQTATDELAMAMFETLNNTGKKLENFYVLKNDIVSKIGEEQVRSKWSTLEGKLDQLNPSKFLMIVATIKVGKVTSENALKKIYDIKDFNKDSVESMELLLDELVEVVDKYLKVLVPAQLNADLKETLFVPYKFLAEALTLFGMSQHHPILVAMFMKRKDQAAINRVMKALLDLAIRNFYFMENKANTVEHEFATIAMEVYNSNLDEESIISRINAIAVSDKKLAGGIKTKSIVSSQEQKKMKFILREAYNKIDLTNELEIKNSLDKIQLEHILPQKPKTDSQWMKDFPNDTTRKDYTYTLGNATLLLDVVNRSASNKNFEDKKETYERSSIPENIVIKNSVKWTSYEIEERTVRLGEKIIKYLHTLKD